MKSTNLKKIVLVRIKNIHSHVDFVVKGSNIRET